MKHTHIHTLRHTPPFAQSAYTKSKPKITWNNAFFVKRKRKNSQIKYKSLGSHIPNPPLESYHDDDEVMLNVLRCQLTY